MGSSDPPGLETRRAPVPRSNARGQALSRRAVHSNGTCGQHFRIAAGLAMTLMNRDLDEGLREWATGEVVRILG